MIKLKRVIEESKYDLHQAKELTFITYGGLSATKQLGYSNGKDPTFHAPPAKRGIYAFVWPYIEKFLLSGGLPDPKKRKKGQRQRASYLKDKHGNVIASGHPDFEKFSDRKPSFARTKSNEPWDPEKHDWQKDTPVHVLYNHANRKKFKYSGEIWHHLGEFCPEWTIFNRHGSWVKTDMNTFAMAFKKEIALSQIPSERHPFTSTMDHLEVFIDEKI